MHSVLSCLQDCLWKEQRKQADKSAMDDWIVFSLLKNHIECLRLMLDK
jgi:hypothetical protein